MADILSFEESYVTMGAILLSGKEFPEKQEKIL